MITSGPNELVSQGRRVSRRLVDHVVYARHGRELMGFKSPVRVSMLK